MGSPPLWYFAKFDRVPPYILPISVGAPLGYFTYGQLAAISSTPLRGILAAIPFVVACCFQLLIIEWLARWCLNRAIAREDPTVIQMLDTVNNVVWDYHAQNPGLKHAPRDIIVATVRKDNNIQPPSYSDYLLRVVASRCIPSVV